MRCGDRVLVVLRRARRGAGGHPAGCAERDGHRRVHGCRGERRAHGRPRSDHGRSCCLRRWWSPKVRASFTRTSSTATTCRSPSSSRTLRGATCPMPGQVPDAQSVGGATMWRLRVPVPADLPLGWHTVHAHGASPRIVRGDAHRCMRAGRDARAPRPAADPRRAGRASVGADGTAVLGALARVLGHRRLRRPRRPRRRGGGARGGLPARQSRARRRGDRAHRAVALSAGDAPLPRPAVRASGGHPRDRISVDRAARSGP